MEIRHLRKDEMVECSRISSQAFMFPFNEQERRERLEKEEAPEKGYLGCFAKSGEMMASLVVVPFDVHYHGHILKMGGIGNVATKPEYRRGGAVREMMRLALGEMKEAGIAVSTLYPFSHPYYRRFGYELCCAHLEHKIAIDSLEGFRHTGWAKLMRQGDDVAPLMALYSKYMSDINLSTPRNAERWQQLIKNDPLQHHEYCYLLGEGDRHFAYLRYRLLREDGTDAIVDDLAFDSPQGMHAILGFLARFSGQYAHARIRLTQKTPMAALINEPYDLATSTNGQPMARVVDVAGVLALHGAIAKHSFTLEIIDEFMPENSGCYHVAGGVVSKTQEKPDAEMDIATFSQLSCGYLTIDQACFKQQCRLNGNESALREAFPQKDILISEQF